MRLHLLVATLLLCSTRLIAAEDEVYVLFRGIHYTRGQVVPLKVNIEAAAPQNCEAPYVTAAGINSHIALNQARQLQDLHMSGSVTENGQVFPSYYDLMAQRYVDGYKSFLNAVRNPHSPLREALQDRCNLTPDNIFLISTSLSPYVGLKYAAGICSPPSDNRREPVNNNELVDPVLGFLDMFVIPAKEIARLFPYFVLEEFARHHIEIPHTIKQKDYTLAEEVIVPFLLPSNYHVRRVALDVSTFSRPRIGAKRKWGDVEWLRTHLKKLSEGVEQRVTQWVKQSGKKQVFLGPLTHQLQKRSYHLEPSRAVAIRRQIETELNSFGHRFFSATSQRIVIDSELGLSFFTAYALQKLGYRGYPMEIDMPFSLDSEDTKWFSIILEAPGIERLALQGNDTEGVRDLIEYDEENARKGQVPANYFLTEFPFWQEPNQAFYGLLKVLSRRTTPLVFDVTGQSLEPEAYEALQSTPGVTVEDANRDEDEYYAYEWWDNMGEGNVEDLILKIQARIQAKA